MIGCLSAPGQPGDLGRRIERCRKDTPGSTGKPGIWNDQDVLSDDHDVCRNLGLVLDRLKRRIQRQQLKRSVPPAFGGDRLRRVVVELYRQGSITQHQLAESLDKSRVEIDELLKQHNVTEDLVTAEEVAEQVATLRRLLGS